MFRTWNKELNRQFCHSNILLQGSWCCLFLQILKLCPKKKSSAAYTFCKAMGLLGMQFHLFENECKSQCLYEKKKKNPRLISPYVIAKIYHFQACTEKKISVEIRSEQGLYNLLLYLKGLILSTIVFLFFSDSIKLVSVLYQSCISISGNVILPVPFDTCCMTFLQASPSLQLRVTFRSLFMITLVTKTPRKVV